MDQLEQVAGFLVIFEREENGGLHALCPELKGCHSYGKTRAEARRNIAEAIALWLESAQELGIKVGA